MLDHPIKLDEDQGGCVGEKGLNGINSIYYNLTHHCNSS